MTGCKRCALKGGGGKGKKKRKEKEKWGSKSFFFPCAVVNFQIYKENCI